MDLNTVASIRVARSRADLGDLGTGVAVLAGGSWLFSEPQDHLTGLVDITGLGWPAYEFDDSGLTIAATCTLHQLSVIARRPGWTSHPLLFQACTALYGSFKVWNVATVGGNIATSLPAGPMTALAAALDADALIWRADGTDESLPVADLVTGNRTNLLGPGDVLRSIHIGRTALAARTAYRKIALSPLGRSGSVVMARLEPDGAFVCTVTGATLRPVQLRFDSLPTQAELANAVDAVDVWFTDAHGAADWRQAVSRVLAEEIRIELAKVPR